MADPLRRRLNRLGAWLYGRLPGLGRRWARRFEVAAAGPAIPWAPLRVPLAEARLALLTTGGPHLRGDPPFRMDDPLGDPSWRAIPAGADPAEITITHDYYDHRDADRDLNIILPLERCRELVGMGALGGLGTAFGFMGHIDGGHVETLVTRSAPAVARTLRAEGVTAALLTPA